MHKGFFPVDARDIVIFTSPDPGLPLPDPRYISIHAARCEVALFSGVGEYIDGRHKDSESTDGCGRSRDPLSN
ncbi:uncharacterized protein EDB91DRAFT_168540 [Suillus paluster]|uniref:uncharacterized protein n=1 Tax=Suillus paluster TaxID=48578 RepID=UPI001B885C64|nr:uncharacterized protein EDB91DRAFT_168540 [Suillus paluster]KAG1744944.1 hypothetical protein EDB91DRAFT_168540 [Suillus paluster]